jgi:hypothetical protein
MAMIQYPFHTHLSEKYCVLMKHLKFYLITQGFISLVTITEIFTFNFSSIILFMIRTKVSYVFDEV